jgi:hypothetical protein
MNGREAIEAMLAGKVICAGDHWRFANGFQRRECAEAAWRADYFGGNSTYELYEEPNPYEPGTFAWAKEEHRRGRDVTNDEASHSNDPVIYRAEYDWNRETFYGAEFETKTWRHA